ncbi:hypothetical protein K435DRAFT_63797 [Dendrothele bispora CBS 962.96]|uniref:Uncharacterized protein n=1 Tax=Dendrothele bispora (strain CBS 962.96) TaxID=1314807 RepID=A0A4S8KR40_DENBC|nr:hypothetical protein K435DRAFT_63797 [Dendrothele bispora CBS 962.96]
MTDTKKEEGSRHRTGEVETRSLRLRRHQSSQETCTADLPGPEPPPDREDKQPGVNAVRIQPQDGNEVNLPARKCPGLKYTWLAQAGHPAFLYHIVFLLLLLCLVLFGFCVLLCFLLLYSILSRISCT